MIYRKRNKNKNIKTIQTIAIFIVIFIFILGFLRMTFINNIFQIIAIPFAKTAYLIKAPFSGIGSFFSTKQTLINNIKSLEDELNQSKLDLIKNQILETENIELRNLSEHSISLSEENIILSKVLLRPPYSPYDTFTLDKGEDDGIKIDSRVLYKDLLLGHIGDVSSKSSIIKLISSPGVETKARVRGSVQAVAIGKGGGRLSIILPKDTEVSVGDVVTAIDSNVIILGTVSHIVVDTIDSFQTLFISLPVSLSSISFVEIDR